MKFKVLYKYEEIIEADYFEPTEDAIRFCSDKSSHWIPKYEIEKIIPLVDED